MLTVSSEDGTRIAFERAGRGPALILLHGTSADRGRWSAVRPALERRFTVFAVDRRGRGGSGDGPDYSLEREVDDVVAVVGATGEPATVLGHSYGALIALEAVRQAVRIGACILYEPVMQFDAPLHPSGAIDELETLLAEGRREEVVASLLRDIVGLPPTDLERLQSHPSWAGRVAAAHTIPRELRVEEEYRFDPGRFTAVAVPTLLLVGGESSPIVTRASDAIHAALPSSRRVVLPGQGHIAMTTAPDLFVRETVGFLDRS